MLILSFGGDRELYTFLFILAIAACVYLIVGSIVIFRKQQRNNSTLDKNASLTTVKHPIIANPIFILYIVIPVVTIVIGMIIVLLTQ